MSAHPAMSIFPGMEIRMPALERLTLRALAALYALGIAAVPVALAQTTPQDNAPVTPAEPAGRGIPWFLILVVALVAVWLIARRRRTHLPPPRAP